MDTHALTSNSKWDEVNSQNAGMREHGILTFQPADILLFQQIKRNYSEHFLIAGSNYRSWKTAVKIDRTELSYHVNAGCFKITSTEMKKFKNHVIIRL